MRFRFIFPTVAMVCATAAPLLVGSTCAAQAGYYTHHYRIHHRHQLGYRDYSGYLDPRSGHYDPEFQHNRENFGFSGRDPSRIGGEDPSLHPAPMGH